MKAYAIRRLLFGWINYSSCRIIMAKQKTKLDAFKRLDQVIDPDARKAIMEGRMEADELHFSLGMWIRNNWIYGPDHGGYREPFQEQNEDAGTWPLFVCSPDSESSAILREYQDYLRQRAKEGKS